MPPSLFSLRLATSILDYLIGFNAYLSALTYRVAFFKPRYSSIFPLGTCTPRSTADMWASIVPISAASTLIPPFFLPDLRCLFRLSTRVFRCVRTASGVTHSMRWVFKIQAFVD